MDRGKRWAYYEVIMGILPLKTDNITGILPDNSKLLSLQSKKLISKETKKYMTLTSQIQISDFSYDFTTK